MDLSVFILGNQVSCDNPGQTQGKAVETCTFLTTGANELMRPLHEPMPVIFDRASENEWLNPGSAPDALRALLVPFAAERREDFPVIPYVSNARNEGPRCLEQAGA